jgi:methyl-accepting chemotaxis protein
MSGLTKLFTPAIKLINTLPYTGKFALIGFLFLIPTAYTMYNYVGEVNKLVTVCTQEKQGITYNQTLKDIFGQANIYYLKAQKAEATDKNSILGIWQKTQAEDASFAPGLKPADQKILAEKKAALEQKVTAFLDSPSEANLNALNADLVAHISYIGDKSNLILDPQLDSYYIMDSIILRLVPINKNLEELRTALETSANKGYVTHDNLIKLMDLKNQIKLNYDALKYGVDVANTYNPNSGVKKELDGLAQQVYTQMDTLLAAYDKQVLGQANALISPGLLKSLETQHADLTTTVEQLYDAQSKTLSRLIQERSDAYWPNVHNAVLATLGLLLVITYLFVGFYMSVNNSFSELIAATEAMAKGDLRQRLDTSTKDEYHKVALGFNRMVDSFKKLINSIQGSVTELEGSSVGLEKTSAKMKDNVSNVAEQTQHAAELTDELANNIMVVASAVEQSSVGVKEVALASETVTINIEKAQNATDEMSEGMSNIAAATQEMSGSVNTIASAVEEMSASLGEVSNSTHHASEIAVKAEERAKISQEIVSQLENSAREIGQVIEVINGIAAQTNLLALNATIQAASAGEAGKGFAVVANEVKELAKKSANATVDIRQRVEEIQLNTNSAIEAIDEISTIIGQISGINKTIANSVQEQTVATTEISNSIASTAQAASNVSDNIQKSAHVAGELNNQIKQAELSVKMINKSVEEIALGTTEISRSSSSVATLAQDMANSVHVVKENTTEVSGSAGQTKQSADNLRSLASELNRLVATFKV